jgi:hypothetical protein
MLRDDVDMVKDCFFGERIMKRSRSRKYETVQRCKEFVARLVFRLPPLFCARGPYLRHILNLSNYLMATIPALIYIGKK